MLNAYPTIFCFWVFRGPILRGLFFRGPFFRGPFFRGRFFGDHFSRDDFSGIRTTVVQVKIDCSIAYYYGRISHTVPHDYPAARWPTNCLDRFSRARSYGSNYDLLSGFSGDYRTRWQFRTPSEFRPSFLLLSIARAWAWTASSYFLSSFSFLPSFARAGLSQPPRQLFYTSRTSTR